MPGDDKQAGDARRARQFPALRILEAAGIALSPASIVIAALASFLLTISGQFVDLIFRPSVQSTPVSIDADRWGTQIGIVPPFDRTLIAAVARPWSSVLEPVISVLNSGWEWGFSARMSCRFALALAAWSLVGVILCRRSAYLFVGHDDSSVRLAIQYGLKRWPASVGAPLIPLVAAFLMAMSLATVGLVGRFPFVGSTWLTIASPFLGLMGFGMAFLLFATACGWPLMVAAIATDDCDSFGGLSRAYSGLTGRPWQVAAHTVFGLLVGIVLMWIVILIGEMTIWCATSCTALGSGLTQAHDSLFGPLTFLADQTVAGIGISFFWSATAVIYLLLRQEVDGIPLDRIAPDDEARPVRDPLPVVGIPATDARTESNGKVPGIDQ